VRSILRAFGVPFVATLAVAGVVAALLTWPSAPSGSPVEVELAALSVDGPSWVRVRGIAHYGSRVTLRSVGGWDREPVEWQLFGLLPDLEGREVRVLVRTLRPPEEGVDFEHLLVEGVVSRADPQRVPLRVREVLEKSGGWWLAEEVVVLEPTRIEAEDGVWEGP